MQLDKKCVSFLKCVEITTIQWIHGHPMHFLDQQLPFLPPIANNTCTHHVQYHSQCCFCVKLHLRHKQTNERTDRDKRTDATNQIWCILALKCDIWWKYFNDS